MMEHQKKRLFWIDSLKVFAILLVIWGHILPRLGQYAPMSIEERFDGLNGLIYSFHMPLFMILSGYVSSKILMGQGDIVRKFKQLIIPCITLFFVCLMVGVDDNFWYLKSLFACYVIWLGYFKIHLKSKLLVAIILCFFLFPLYQQIPLIRQYKIDFMLPFFGIGLLLHEKANFVKEHLKVLLVIFGILSIILEFMWSDQYVFYNSRANWIDYNVLWEERKFLFNWYNLYCNLFRDVTGFVVSCFFIFLFILIYEKGNQVKMLNKIASGGGYSLHVYILQVFVIKGMLAPFHIILPSENVNTYYLLTLGISFVILIVCIFIAKVLERNRYINKYIFGKSYN